MAATVYERDNCTGGSFSAWVTMAIKADNFVWRKYYLLIVIILLKNASKNSRRPQIAFLFLSRAAVNSFLIIFYLGTTQTEISACKAT